MTIPPTNATTPIGDLLRQIAHRIAPTERAPLLHSGEIALPDAAPQPTPLAPEMLVAWRALLGETGLPWQVEALTTARRGSGIALVAPAPLGPATVLLLAAERLNSEGAGTTILLAPDEVYLADIAATAGNIDALLGGGLAHHVIDSVSRPPRTLPPLLMTTYEILHRRVLRSHDRGWAALWPRLGAVVLPAVDVAPGTPLGHTRWLLRRMTRLRPIARPLIVYASLAPLGDINETLSQILDILPPTVIANTSRVPLTWALWRGGTQPVEAAVELAVALRQSGLTVHLDALDPLERALLAQRGAAQGLTIAAKASAPAHTLVLLGATDGTTLPSLAASGYRAVVMITDDSIAARVAIAQPAVLTPGTPLALPIALQNAYVSGAHLRCAAEEQPLTRVEAAQWESENLIERLVARGVLAELPGADAWQPVAIPGAPNDTYAQLHPNTATDAPVPVYDEEGRPLAQIDPVAVERRLYPGAVVRGGRVVGWGDDGSVTVRAQGGGRSFAERRTQVTVREELAQRILDGGRADLPLLVGRVVVAEDIVARRGITPEGDTRRVPFDPPLHVQWSAPAVWIAAPQAHGQLGETLAGVLPLLLRCAPNELVPCVANETLYLVEAQPGGRGVIDQLYGQFEALLHLAGIAARALADDPIFGTAARADLAWLETILMPLASPLRADAPPLIASTPAVPSVERRTRASMVATPSEVAARRRPRGNTFAVPRSLPTRGSGGGEPPAEIHRVSEVPRTPDPAPQTSRPSQPMRLPSQPPQQPRDPLPARPATRSEAPAAPLQQPVRAKLGTPRPATRRGGPRLPGRPAHKSPEAVGSGRDTTAVRAQPKPSSKEQPSSNEPPARPAEPAKRPEQTGFAGTAATPPPEPRQPSTIPARREPPPLERPPFQTRQTDPHRAAPQDPTPTSGAPAAQPPTYGHSRAVPPATRNEPAQQPPAQQRPATRNEPAPPPADPRRTAPPPADQRRPAQQPPADQRQPAQQRPATRPDPTQPPADPRRTAPPPADQRRPAQQPPADQRQPAQQRPATRPDPTPPPADQRRPAQQPPADQRRPAQQPPADQRQPAQQRPAARTEPPADQPPTYGRGRPVPPATRNEPAQRPADQRRPAQQPPAQRNPGPPERTPQRDAPPPPLETSSDPEALLAKARRLREQREAQLRREQGPPKPAPPVRQSWNNQDAPDEKSRFNPGDHVFCVPYGQGVVQKARVRDGRELLLVAFPGLGDLRVDPAVNAVRLIEGQAEQEDNESFDE